MDLLGKENEINRAIRAWCTGEMTTDAFKDKYGIELFNIVHHIFLTPLVSILLMEDGEEKSNKVREWSTAVSMFSTAFEKIV